MMLYAAIVVGTVLACEIGLRLPLARILGSVNALSWRAVEVVGSARISDHWKERVLPAYSWRIMKASAALFLCLLAIALPVVAAAALVLGSFAKAGTALMQPLSLLLMTAVGLGYIFVRVRLGRGAATEAASPEAESASSSDYSGLDKTLHKVVLGNPMLNRVLPRLDARFARGAAAVHDPVYVTGLARGGTTMVMRALHGSGRFASLTYADMPFVLAPNLWARISRADRKARRAVERAHGDGVIVDADAPEALEEVFWRSRCGPDYIQNTGLVPHSPDPETLAAYRAYQARVCHRYGVSRYLAKNNNLMLRIGPLAAAMPEARILILVRDPAAQARSLLAQHLRFRAADDFTRDYMRWLVHHEFGPDQRPYRLPGQPVPTGSPDRIDYWLTEWLACYSWLRDAAAERPETIRPVLYERLIEDPGNWHRICDLVRLSPAPEVSFRPTSRSPAPDDLDPDLMSRARAVYADLAERAV